VKVKNRQLSIEPLPGGEAERSRFMLCKTATQNTLHRPAQKQQPARISISCAQRLGRARLAEAEHGCAACGRGPCQHQPAPGAVRNTPVPAE